MQNTIGCTLSQFAGDLGEWRNVMFIVDESKSVKGAVRNLVEWGYADWVGNQSGGISSHEAAQNSLEFHRKLKEYSV